MLRFFVSELSSDIYSYGTMDCLDLVRTTTVFPVEISHSWPLSSSRRKKPSVPRAMSYRCQSVLIGVHARFAVHIYVSLVRFRDTNYTAEWGMRNAEQTEVCRFAALREQGYSAFFSAFFFAFHNNSRLETGYYSSSYWL